jgi:hypothetical protein
MAVLVQTGLQLLVLGPEESHRFFQCGKTGQEEVDDPFGVGSGKLNKVVSLERKIVHGTKMILKILKVKRFSKKSCKWMTQAPE